EVIELFTGRQGENLGARSERLEGGVKGDLAGREERSELHGGLAVAQQNRIAAELREGVTGQRFQLRDDGQRTEAGRHPLLVTSDDGGPDRRAAVRDGFDGRDLEQRRATGKVNLDYLARAALAGAS